MRRFNRVAFTACLLSCVLGCRKQDTGVVAILDAVHPETEVYYRGILLGKTPLRVTREMCQEFGFVVPGDQIFDDGYGEGAFFGVEDEEEEKITFLAPEEYRREYLTLETPWGTRTKLGGSRTNHANSPVHMTTDFMKLTDGDGIRLQLEPLRSEYQPGEEIEVKLTLSASGDVPVTGFRPEVQAFWGTFDTPWRNRSCLRVPLDEQYRVISPGDTHSISFKLKAPSVAENYSLFVLLHLFEKESGDRLSIGAVYSESRLIRVRR